MSKRGASKKSEKRERNGLRKVAQRVFETLIEIVSESGDDNLAKALTNRATIEDVMRDAPEVVKHLLDLTWSLREDDRIRQYLSGGDGTPVSTKEDSISPCDTHFAGICIAHLTGTARLVVARVEREWAESEAKSRQRDYATLVSKMKRNPIGLCRLLFRSLFRRHPRFRPIDMMPDSPKIDLYPALKPHLKDTDQFSLVTAYASLNKRQVEAIGNLIRGITDPAAIERLAEYDSRQLKVLAECCWAFADTVLVHPKTSKDYTERLPRNTPLLDGVDLPSVLGGQILTGLVMTYEDTVPTILLDDTLSKTLATSLCVPLMDETWSVFRDSEVMANISRCPTDVVHGIGSFAGHVPEQVSIALHEFENPTIARDLLEIGLEAFGEDQMSRLLNDSGLVTKWTDLPARFNGKFNYSRESNGGSVKNIYDLRDEAKVIFKAMRESGSGMGGAPAPTQKAA